MSARKQSYDLTPLRLEPGEDLRQALLAFCLTQRIKAGFVIAGIGSLAGARLRYAGNTRTSVIRGKLELLALSGSLSTDGNHLHALIADARGHPRGGHVAEGCLIRTTAEILIARIPGMQFRRVFDAGTGYRELVIRAGGSTYQGITLTKKR